MKDLGFGHILFTIILEKNSLIFSLLSYSYELTFESCELTFETNILEVSAVILEKVFKMSLFKFSLSLKDLFVCHILCPC